jgi:hypothetical protein
MNHLQDIQLDKNINRMHFFFYLPCYLRLCMLNNPVHYKYCNKFISMWLKFSSIFIIQTFFKNLNQIILKFLKSNLINNKLQIDYIICILYYSSNIHSFCLKINLLNTQKLKNDIKNVKIIIPISFSINKYF